MNRWGWPGAVWLLLLATGLRHVALGAIAVVLGLHLDALGFGPVAVGGLFTAMLGAGAVGSAVFGVLAHRVGGRRLLLVTSVSLAVSSLAFALGEAPWLLVGAALLGAIGPTGYDTGPALALEQAALAETTTSERRTGVFAAHTLVAMFGSGVGAAAVAVPERLGASPLEAYRLAFAGAASIGLVTCMVVSRLPERVEPHGRAHVGRFRLGLYRSQRLVLVLSALFAVDAFAGGLAVQSAVAYWFAAKFGASTAMLGTVFSGAQFLMAGSLLLAAPLTRRFGPVNTMVFTHLPANVILMLVPFMPTFELAATLFVARHLTATLDVPPRQALLLTLVEPDERAAAAGLTGAARTAGSAVAPAIAGVLWSSPVSGLPLIVAGLLKSAYDLALYAVFRGTRIPEPRQASSDSKDRRTLMPGD